MGVDTADNRWQGYSHQELYDMLHSGPGSTAAGAAADRWSNMSTALADIQQDITTGVQGSGATWVGTAADSARDALGPLGDWAQQASTAADMMRISTELQGDLLGKARADMPVPVPEPKPLSPIMQLVSGQTDHEIIELAREAGAQRAYQVMAAYENGTTDNTSTLGEFGEPPTLVVDTSPVAGISVRGPVRFGESVHQVPRTSTGGRATPFTERTAGSARPGTTSSGKASRVKPAAPREVETDPGEPAERTSSGTPTAPRTTGVPTGSATETPATPASTSTSTSTSTNTSASTPQSVSETAPHGPDGRPPATVGGIPEQSTTTSSAPVEPTSNTGSAGGYDVDPAGGRGTGSTDRFGTSAGRSGGPANGTPNSGNTNPSGTAPGSSDRQGSGSVGTPIGGAVVPSARRPNHEDEPDDAVHESKYLIEADDIYGDRMSYSPPVIGESRPRR